MSRMKYGENGRPEYREDLTGRPHYDKSTGEYLNQHRHNFKYNDKGKSISVKSRGFPMKKTVELTTAQFVKLHNGNSRTAASIK